MSNEISIFNEGAMASMVKFSELMATSTIAIPKEYQGNPGNCMAVVMQAQRWGMDPYIVASKTHVVSGTLGYEAQLVNAVITSSNAIKGRFHYEYSEEEWKNGEDPKAWIRVGAQISGEDEIQWGEKLYPSQVKVKNSPLWKTNPKQQCGYLAVKMWSRLYTPHVIMGVYTKDEAQEKAEREVNPDLGKTSSINIPKNVDTGTGEILESDAELESFEPEEEVSTTKRYLAGMTIPAIKNLMNACEAESELMEIGKDIKGTDTILDEDREDLKKHFDKKLKMMRMP